MATHAALKASTLTADSRKGQEAVAVFRAQYNKAELDDERGQILNQNKAFAAGLLELIERCSMPVQAPEGGCIHIVRVPVDPGRQWQEAIDAVGPDTGKNWDVRKVGDKYLPQPGEPKNEEIILVNFGKTIPNAQHALDWATQYSLTPKSPRSVFAVGEHKPHLHRELKLSGMAIIAPVPCTFEGVRRVCDAWLRGDGRFCGLHWFGCGFRDDCWFAFGRE